MLIASMKRNFFRSATYRPMVTAALLLVAVVVGITLPLFFNTHKAEAAWWNGTWGYRRKITFNNTASAQNLVNFPVRVSLSSSTVTYSKTQDSGQDIRFVDSDDTTVLNHEIEKWDESGTSEVWVQVPQINASSSTDFIWMYYGNASASDAQNGTAIWGANYAWSTGYSGVWHSSETGSALNDSTANANNGTKTNVTSTTGKIGGAQTYGASAASVVTVADSNSLDMTDNMTISAWVNATSFPDWMAIACKGSAPNYCFQTDPTRAVNFNYTATFLESVSTTLLSANTWYFVSVVYDNAANQVRIYINGALDSTTSQTTALPANTSSLLIGNDTASEEWMGVIDELRITSGIQPADWIEAEYISDNNAMNSFGAEEQYPPDPPILTALGNSAALQPVFQMRAADRTDPNYLRYKVQVCSNSDCSSVVRTIDQTSSQTGWSGQDAQTGTAYVASSTVGSSTLASHTYQTPALSAGTQYWWRAYAIDPGGSNAWSDTSAIGSFITTGPPAAPTLIEPVGGIFTPLAPMLRLWTTDPNGDNVRYKIEVCSTNNCSAVVRTIDQTSSQTGWVSQDGGGATSYSAGTVLSGSQQAAHAYQSPLLSGNVQYWWRAYAIDPGGYNQWSSASSIGTFTTKPSNVNVVGGTTVKGGTKIGQ